MWFAEQAPNNSGFTFLRSKKVKLELKSFLPLAKTNSNFTLTLFCVTFILMPSLKISNNTKTNSGFTFLRSKKAKPNAGFTLIEILIAISIIGIVFAVIISSATSIQKSTRDAQRQSDLRNIQSSLAQYYADRNYYPDVIDLSTATIFTDCTGWYKYSGGSCTPSKNYLSSLPKDPTGSSYKYRSGIDGSSTVSKRNSCDYAVSSTKCHYYLLCAKLESPTQDMITKSVDCSTAVDNTYNFQISPI